MCHKQTSSQQQGTPDFARHRASESQRWHPRLILMLCPWNCRNYRNGRTPEIDGARQQKSPHGRGAIPDISV
jgi:hypothetical protein